MNTPSKWYWVICVLGLLWNAGGAYDYIMTVTENVAYLSQVPAETMAYYESMPAWTMWPWAIAVWGSVLGWVWKALASLWLCPETYSA